MEYTATIILAVVLIVREYQNWKDRKDLLDRIMCTDYREYSVISRGPAKSKGNTRMSEEQLAKEEAARGK